MYKELGESGERLNAVMKMVIFFTTLLAVLIVIGNFFSINMA